MRPTLPRGRRERLLFGYSSTFLLTLSLAVGLLVPAQAAAEDVCARLWTVAGKGTEAPWLRSNGYQIGMKKAQAHQLRRGGMITSVAQDTWQLNFGTSMIVLEFQKGKLTSATLMLAGRDFQEAYPDVLEQMGPPDDFGKDYVLWRNEECNTIKALIEDGDNVTIAIRKLDDSGE